MAEKRMTLKQALAAPSKTDWKKVDAATEEDIRRMMVEDGEDPDAPFDPSTWVPAAASIRHRLKMSQAEFAAAIQVPVATLRNWEQHRTKPDPAARALLLILDREPKAALRALKVA